MMTWELWRALQKPYTRHPVFHRAILMRKVGVGNVSFITPLLKVSGRLSHFAKSHFVARFVLGLLAIPLVLLMMLTVLFAGATMLMFGGPIGLLVISNKHGLSWALGIASLIATEREQNTYDLLCATPFGTWQTMWSIATGYAHYDSTLATVKNFRAWQLLIICVIMPFIGSMILLQFGANPFLLLNIPTFIVYLIAYTVVLYIDQFQSIVIGVLVGMIVPHFTRSLQEARIWVTGAFILLQGFSYLATGLVCFALLPVLLGMTQFLTTIAVPFLSVLFFYLLHEALIRLLWCLLNERVDRESTVIDVLIPDAV